MAAGGASSSSGMSTPPIIPGPGQGTIPSLQSQPHAQASVPGSAANSPPGQHAPHLGTSSAPSTPRRSMSAGGHLHPILPKAQSNRPSPASSPRSRLLAHPSPSGIKPFDVTRVGPSPLSSPCSSPPLAPMVPNSSALANALPTVLASHQHSAAVAAAAAAAAAASAGSNGNRSIAPATPSSMVARHNSAGHLGSQLPSLPMVVSGRKHSSHSVQSSISSVPSSGVPSATTSPYASPYPGPHSQQGYPGSNQGGQGQAQPGHHFGQQQYPSQHHGHHHPHGSGIVLPSIGAVTNPSSPMPSPHHGPHSMASLPLPTPISLPAPVIGHDSHSKQSSQQHYGHPSNTGHHGHVHSLAHPHAHSNVHPHEGLPILPPLGPR